METKFGAIVERLEDSIKTEVGKVGDEKWKLGIRAIEKIRNAKSDQDLLRIIKEEIVSVIKSSGASGVDTITSDNIGITLDDVRQLLRQTQKRSNLFMMKQLGINQGFFQRHADIVGVDKKPTIYVNQGTALKVFVNQDIVFPPQSILNNEMNYAALDTYLEPLQGIFQEEGVNEISINNQRKYGLKIAVK
nr:unnamed protein product [Callosobruchus chinensis]